MITQYSSGQDYTRIWTIKDANATGMDQSALVYISLDRDDQVFEKS
jgi:hypothetical protein